MSCQLHAQKITEITTILQTSVAATADISIIIDQAYQQAKEYYDNKKRKKGQKPLAGISFCITGELLSGTRQSVWGRIRNAGGIVDESIRRGTDYLIVGDPGRFAMSSKKKKAHDYGVRAISESEFHKMLTTPGYTPKLLTI